MNMQFMFKLPIPKDIKKQYSISREGTAIKKKRDAEIKSVLNGKSNKFILIIGPCSADSEKSVLDYASRLSRIQNEVHEKLIIIPRIYTNKPRTMGNSYKGMLHQPDPEKAPNILKGLISIRKLHLKVIEQAKLTCADEMLYPDNYMYLSDLLSYVVVGARSSENQQHRLVASGINIPTGIKNSTSGNIKVMLNSIAAAQYPQAFVYRGWEVRSKGNVYAHAILRGYINSYGDAISNYHYEDLLFLSEAYSKRNLANPACIIDCNHSNSGKKYIEQIRIAKEILYNMKYNKNIKQLVKGLMIESYIEDGNQKIGQGVYGKSITDPCLGWNKSKELIYYIADKII